MMTSVGNFNQAVVDPIFTTLKGEPRFQALKARAAEGAHAK